MTVPAGYRALARGAVRAVVREDLASRWQEWLLAPTLVAPPGATPTRGGRGDGYHATRDGVRIVVRPFRRGGWLGRVVQRTYVGLRPRPLVELSVTAAARSRGAPVPEVLAARVEGGLAYRGAIVTAELADVHPLLDALEAATDAGGRARVARAAGAAVGALHALGVFHADLNCTNILVPAATDARAIVIDLDRGRLGARRLGRRARCRNLRRLARSQRKLDPEGRLVDAATRAAFVDAYRRTLETTCAS